VHGAVLSGRDAAEQILRAVPGGGTIAVIGAGAAGLAATATLRQHHRVVVLEARDRIGGRIWTDRSLGYPVELGAGWIHGPVDNPLVPLAEIAGVETVEMDWDSVSVQPADARSGDSLGGDLLGIALHEAETVRSDDPDDRDLGSVIAEVGRRRRWSDAQRDALARAAVTEIDHEFGAGPAELSARFWDEGVAPAGGDLLVIGGFDRVLEPLSEGLDIRLRTPVREVHWSDTAVRVLLDTDELSADAVVLTAPASLLRAGIPRLIPEPPEPWSTALEALGSGLLDKVVLGFEHAFWSDEWVLRWRGQDPGVLAERVNLHAAAGRPAVVGFNAAGVARLWERRSDERIAEDALRVLRRFPPG
jgi:monoamine oxidase